MVSRCLCIECSYFDIRSVAFQDCDFLGEVCSFELFFIQKPEITQFICV